MTNSLENLHRRIATLAACIDPIAFERLGDVSLRKRREAAWREAINRIGHTAEAL